MQYINIPRALRGAVHAQQSTDQIAAEIRATLGDMRTNLSDRITNIDETVGNLTASLSEMQRQIEGGGYSNSTDAVIPAEPEYTRNFGEYLRGNGGDTFLREANASGDRRLILASMSVGDNSAGGYLAPVEWDRRVRSAARSVSPMRRLASVQSISVGGYTSLWSDEAAGSGWVGETAARPNTTTPTISQLEFASGEIYANAAATQTLLDDSAINAEQWLIGVITREFARQEDIAFIAGNGVNKPRGLLTYVEGGASADLHPGGNLTVMEEALAVDALVDFAYGLASPYRQNSTWLMSSLTAAAITRMKDGDGNLIWRESLIAGQPATLLGRPVELDETMPPPTAGNIAVAFGDFEQAYQIVDRLGIRVLRDPYTNKPFVNHYCTKRVGAGLLDPNAVRLLRIPA